ncbi:RNA polymerase sigma factor [Rhodoplanes sp. TEM]|uniref:RNA polymerase sigma factor n=1 Tax=Rhodoplanes tepidamans TaxID=200616 RepID=A0ABT5JEI2_RHOTP|nr:MULTISPECIES: RNA polymerase sigma factor [Rhodoplanes]MDC7788022.1 RNA polymerase sigma factor [Rhodoplanes tepidamans]MDC7987899.1 RNA polymerase sigma factor [Rhodoplanes sp. TEM]MDQ0353989.1 RNA polymerase sigma-70 factor (ECF subfamily) [Rhodoplanes tepidamans]
MRGRTIDVAGLYASENGRLKRLVRRLVGNGATAEDLVHQAFVKLMATADCGDLANCPAYLACTARNLALNHLRDTARRAEIALGETDLDALPDLAPSPEAAAIVRCELRRVLQAVAALPPRRREAFVLNKFEGLSYDEIARRQGVSRNTVISQIVAALAELDRRLQQSG